MLIISGIRVGVNRLGSSGCVRFFEEFWGQQLGHVKGCKVCTDSLLTLHPSTGSERAYPKTRRAGACAPTGYSSLPGQLGIPLRGIGIPLRGIGIPLRGIGIPLRGIGIPLRGIGIPLRGTGGCPTACFRMGSKMTKLPRAGSPRCGRVLHYRPGQNRGGKKGTSNLTKRNKMTKLPPCWEPPV